MRIIAGRWRSRRLVAPRGRDTRPTTDRVREALFQHLEAARLGSFDDLKVLDLFAGAGTLGLEALSRGAGRLTAVEADRKALEAIRQNVSALDASDLVSLVGRRLPRALRALPASEHELVFADPPYALVLDETWGEQLASVCAPAALLVYEHDSAVRPELGDRWCHLDRRTYGATTISLYEHAARPGVPQ